MNIHHRPQRGLLQPHRPPSTTRVSRLHPRLTTDRGAKTSWQRAVKPKNRKTVNEEPLKTIEQDERIESIDNTHSSRSIGELEDHRRYYPP